MPRLSESDALKCLADLVDDVALASAPIQIVGKRQSAVLVSADAWQAIQKQLGLISTGIQGPAPRHPARSPENELDARGAGDGLEILISRRTEELSDVTHRLMLVLNSAAEGICGLDKKGRCIFMNTSALQMLGYASEEELLGRNMHEAIHHTRPDGSAYPVEECPVLSCFREGTTIVHCDTDLFWRKDGTSFPAEYWGHPVHDRDGNIIGAVSSFFDISEKLQVQNAAKLSEEKYRRLHESMRDAYASLDMRGKIIETNQAFQAMLGYTPDELTRLTSADLTPPQWHAMEVRIVAEQVLVRGYSDVYEKEYIRKDGSVIPVELRVFQLGDGGGEPAAMWTIVRDISEQKKAQEILLNEKARLRMLLQTMPALVWMKDPQGVYLVCNARFERFFGAKEADILGKTDYDFVPAELADFFRENDLKAAMSGKPTTNEEWVTYADDGHRELLETIKTPVHDADGKFIGVLGIARDITEQRRVEEELDNERLRFRNLVDSVDGIVWEMDVETFAFTYVSKQAERLLGYPLADWSSPGFWVEHLHPDDREWVYEYCMSRTARLEDHNFEYRFIAQDGKTVWIHDIVTVVDEGGKPRWLRGIMVDTTGKKLEELERQKLEAQLRQAQKMEAIGRLAGGVAHDFNNKLTVILGYAEIAHSTGNQSEKYREYLDQIIKAALLSRDITRQLLAFSRQEVISPRALNLNTLIIETEKTLSRLIGEDVGLTFRPATGLWVVKADPSQIDQILMNLAINARDAMPDGGSLTIETANVHVDEIYCQSHIDARPGDYVCIRVSDTGTGMDRETLKHIFEPFFTTKEIGKGTGLGLATIFGIVTQNNGFINVYSEPGHGSTFSIHLPRVLEDRGTGQPLAKPPVTGSGNILVVEDDGALLAMISEMLGRIGYTVLPAGNPMQAIALCGDERVKIDMIITDVIMPAMSGKEMVERIIPIRPGIKILYMSGYTSDAIAQKGVLGEGTCFIQKPFDMITLSEKIKETLMGKG